MSKKKKVLSQPSKAYLVSFGDTMTALLAFFIVLNSLAKEQTGAKMYAGTGSFVAAIKSVGVPGIKFGDRSSQVFEKESPAPIYAFDDQTNPPHEDAPSVGPDDTDDGQRVVDREAENFQRFLNEIDRQFPVKEDPPIRSQIVFDSFERFEKNTDSLLGKHALQMAADAISQLDRPEFDVEIVVWSKMPSPKAIGRAMDQAEKIQQQVDALFYLTAQKRRRLRFSAMPWLFSDAKRPVMSFVVSRLDPTVVNSH